MPLMHIMYGGIVASFIFPFIYDFLKGNTIQPFQFAAGVWAAQTYFYYFRGVRANQEKNRIQILLTKAESLLGASHTINRLLLEKISLINPSILKEAGLTITKRKKVNNNDV